MTTRLPYTKMYWADYRHDTRDLTLEEHGAYFCMLGLAWDRGGTLPNDMRWLQKLCRKVATIDTNNAVILSAL